ncbi:MAG: LptF/LptG family permease [Alphaproteobacteria bacterium]|nr:LptF/LptG family permease [Alphaproteobacteria bacterium]
MVSYSATPRPASPPRAPRSPAPPRRRAAVPAELTGYLLREMTVFLLIFAGVLTAMFWLLISLDMLELVLSRGQSALTFLWLSLMVLPRSMPPILSVAVFLGVLYVLHRLQSDGELPVIWAAGVGQFRLLLAPAALAALVILVIYAINLWAMPAGYRAFKDRIYEIRGEHATALLKEGQFSTPVPGLTTFIGEAPPGGDLKMIFAHDNRNAAAPTTYIAERGLLRSTDAGPRLIMENGNLQWIDPASGALNRIKFDQYSLDLSGFISTRSDKSREFSERYLHELFWPDLSRSWDARNVTKLAAEGHSRLATPLYALSFALIAFAAVACGPYSRRRPIGRMVGAACLTLGLVAVSVGLVTLTAELPSLFALQYAVPVSASGLTLYLIHRDNSGRRGPLLPAGLLDRLRRHLPRGRAR